MVQTTTYKKAPLVELIVEIRWSVRVPGVPSGSPIVSGKSADFDLWFQQITERLRAHGFHDLERLVPHGMVVLAQQPVYRYRRNGGAFPIVQLGHGIFSVHAGPPTYQSWSGFRTEVKQAIAALIEAKPPNVVTTTFSRVVLRYIDRFGLELRAGASNYSFIRDQLGITIDLPEGLIELAQNSDKISPIIGLNLPVAGHDNAQLTFQVAAGRLGTRATTDTIMDMGYAVTGKVPLDVNEVLERLDSAYTVIHGWFEVLIGGIRDRLEPVAEG